MAEYTKVRNDEEAAKVDVDSHVSIEDLRGTFPKFDKLAGENMREARAVLSKVTGKVLVVAKEILPFSYQRDVKGSSSPMYNEDEAWDAIESGGYGFSNKEKKEHTAALVELDEFLSAKSAA